MVHTLPIVSAMRFALLILLCTWRGSTALSAQSPRSEDRDLAEALRPGATVWITDVTGREQKTRIVGTSQEIVTVAAGNTIRRLHPGDITRVRAPYSDSLWNGALIGASVAVASGLSMCTAMEPWENCRDDVGPMLRIGALGAAVGAGVDALIRGRRTIYEVPKRARLDAAPIVTSRAVALYVSLRLDSCRRALAGGA